MTGAEAILVIVDDILFINKTYTSIIIIAVPEVVRDETC